MPEPRLPLTGTTREPVDDTERDALNKAGALAVDARRSRPHYFDGRFLTARDLTNDQHYILRRQADLGRATGWGVVQGLTVQRGSDATRLRIRRGHGITPAGEPVVLDQDLDVDLLDLRKSELLDGHLGLRKDRSTASRVRTGAFVLALRPVEYTANPRAGYPTTIQGARKTEDHDIIEATAVTLVPWPVPAAGSPEDVRRQLAFEIFVRQEGRGLTTDLLPLALVYLDGVSLRWVDAHLVRRPVGSEQEDLLGLGLVSRGVRAAFVRQYREHLRTVLGGRGGRPLSAADAFDALPPVGELPLASIDRKSFSQAFFPPEMDVDLSFVPRDELGLLVDEALMLPPIDLSAPSDALASVSVLVLVPVERAAFRRFKATLGNVRRPLVRRVGRIPVLRTPMLALSRLRLPVIQGRTPATPGAPTDPESAAWTALLDLAASEIGQSGLCWYVRRRNLNVKTEIQGLAVDIDVTTLATGEDT